MGPHQESCTARRETIMALQSDSCKCDSKRRDKSYFVEHRYYLQLFFSLKSCSFPGVDRLQELHLPWYFALIFLREWSPRSQFRVTRTL